MRYIFEYYIAITAIANIVQLLELYRCEGKWLSLCALASVLVLIVQIFLYIKYQKLCDLSGNEIILSFYLFGIMSLGFVSLYAMSFVYMLGILPMVLFQTGIRVGGKICYMDGRQGVAMLFCNIVLYLYSYIMNELHPLPKIYILDCVISVLLVLQIWSLVRRVTNRNEQLNERVISVKDSARKDGLTGLYNRATLDSYMDDLIQSRASFSVVMMDIDFFKRVNDTFGHQAGDEVLRTLAALLLFMCEAGTMQAFRYGGEEFMVVLPDVGINGAVHRAECIRQEFSKHEYIFENESHYFTMSLGVATYNFNRYKTKEELVESCDQALYRAKTEGKNCVRVGK